MTTIHKHQGIPVTLLTVPDGTEEDYAFLDLGYPADVKDNMCSGPRIGVRRLQGGDQGWRIVLHPDGGDPFVAYDIYDADKDGPPKIISDEHL